MAKSGVQYKVEMLYELLKMWRDNPKPINKLRYEAGPRRYEDLSKRVGPKLKIWGISLLENRELGNLEIRLAEIDE